MEMGSPRVYLSRSVRSVMRLGEGLLGPLYTVCSGLLDSQRRPAAAALPAPAASAAGRQRDSRPVHLLAPPAAATEQACVRRRRGRTAPAEQTGKHAPPTWPAALQEHARQPPLRLSQQRHGRRRAGAWRLRSKGER